MNSPHWMIWRIDVPLVVAIVGAFVAGAIYFHDWQQTMERAHDELQETIDRVEKSVEEIRPTLVEPDRESHRDPPVDDQDIAGPVVLDGYAIVLGATSGKTICGMDFGPEDLFAARYDLPCGTEVVVRNTINDATVRLPVLEASGSETHWSQIVLAVSEAASERLQISSGRAPVRVTVDGP